MSRFNDQEVEQYWRLRLCLATLGIKVEGGGWADCCALLVHPTEPVHPTAIGNVPNHMRVSLRPSGDRFHIVYGPAMAEGFVYGNRGLGGHDLRSVVRAVLAFVQDGGS